MIVEALRHQFESQSVSRSTGLLQFRSLVLKPNFDLGFVEVQLGCECVTPVLVQVLVGGELSL